LLNGDSRATLLRGVAEPHVNSVNIFQPVDVGSASLAGARRFTIEKFPSRRELRLWIDGRPTDPPRPRFSIAGQRLAVRAASAASVGFWGYLRNPLA